MSWTCFRSEILPSPITTVYKCQLDGQETLKERTLTRYYSCPPDWILEVGVIIARIQVGRTPLGSII